MIDTFSNIHIVNYFARLLMLFFSKIVY